MDMIEKVTMAGEEWKSIPGYPNYMVSNKGRIWSENKGGIMRQPIRRGYPSVLLYCKGEKPKKFRVSRLVAQAFLPQPEGKDVVDHIDEDHMNNRVENLRWVTAKENREFYMKNHGQWYKETRPECFPCPADTDEERWRICEGFPDYFVSDMGRVWSTINGRVISISSGRCVSLSKDKRMHNRTVATLVANAFLPPKEDGQVLRYKNKDRSDHRAVNLYWAFPYRPKSHKRGRPSSEG